MSAHLRPDDMLADGLGRWARARRGTELVAWSRASVGYSNETIVADLADGDRVVLRLPPQVGIFPAYDLAMETAVIDAAQRSGVAVPHPVVLEPDPAFVGAAFMVMPFVEGRIPGEVAALDPWVGGLGERGQRAMHEAFAAGLASIHRVPVDAALGLRPAGPALDDELDHWGAYLDWVFAGDPLPQLRDGLAWCREHRPRQVGAPVLLWGDVRTGNVVFDERGAVRAFLDWEMASYGPPELDLGWYLALERLIAGFVGSTVEGFCDHDGFVDAYCAAGGAAPADLEWYETFALVRSTAIHSRTMLLAAEAGSGSPEAVRTNPVLAIIAAAIGA